MAEFIPAVEAAAELDVDPRRIRAMIQEGQLEAEKVGGRWLVKRLSLERCKGLRPGQGRPFNARNAWALLLLAAREEPDWVSPQQRSRLRSYLRRGDLADLLPELRRRAAIHRFRAHPSDLPRLAQERRVVRSGASAAGEYGIDLHAPGVLEAYVPSNRLSKLSAKYRLSPSDNPNVILRAVEGMWPFENASIAPPTVVAADLLEADDARSRRAAQQLARDLNG
jgi:excisionase family DNA binding protein